MYDGKEAYQETGTSAVQCDQFTMGCRTVAMRVHEKPRNDRSRNTLGLFTQNTGPLADPDAIAAQ